MKFYISTIAADAAALARRYGAGLELAEYCTAYNMDTYLEQTDTAVQKKLDGVAGCVLHGPFNELFPCAIDPKARELAACRFRQAAGLARRYGAEKLILHGGYNPRIYYPCWYTEQSVAFWRDFLKEDPGVQIVLENVLEEEPDMLLDIIRTVDDPRLRLCLDVGHVNAYSQVPVMEWLERWGTYTSHFHIHNNDRSADTHSPLDQGTLPISRLLKRIEARCPEATVTLELPEAESSVRWLLEEGLWN